MTYVSAQHSTAYALMIANRFMQRARHSSSHQQVLQDMVDSMAAAFKPREVRVAFYHIDPFGDLRFDRANSGLEIASHVNGIKPEGPFKEVIERRGFLYVPDIIQPPLFCDVLDFSDKNITFSQIKYSLDSTATGRYIKEYGDKFMLQKRKMDMVFGCLSVPGENGSPYKIFGAIRADSFPSGKPMIRRGMTPQSLLDTFAILGNTAAQVLDEMKIRTDLHDQRQEARDLAQKAVEAMGRLKHNFSGALTTPIGYLDMVLEQMSADGSENLAPFINMLQKVYKKLLGVSPRMDRVVNKMRGGKFEITVSLKPADIRSLTKDLSEIHEVKIDENVPETIVTDPSRVLNILFGLIENARKYSPQRSLICISIEKIDKEIMISVSDQGKGLTAEQIEKIFEGGYRVDQNISGTGWGLYGFRKIAETLGGRLWAESEGLGKGSTFRFTLPIT